MQKRGSGYSMRLVSLDANALYSIRKRSQR